ncbi:MAG: alpha/beta hydrolase [Candidatus Eremiobacteraeota bacterium]|nr:alpha/beta hydrolase [Candidatus Eremiobacteraeota bacterium]
MSYFAAKDGTQIYYKEWGAGRPIVFSHGWPLSADAWDRQMFFLVQRGYRCIAHDRRGHGRSAQPSAGNDMNTYADDLAALAENLDLEDAVHVGHATGGGEVARYIGRNGSKRVGGAVFVSAVAPQMLKTRSNSMGTPIAVFDGFRARFAADKSQFLRDTALPFFGANRPGANVSQGILDSFWLQGMQGGFIGLYECIKAFSETNFTDDLTKVDVPSLVLHGDDDQLVPIADAGLLSAKIIPNAQLKVYAGAPHGMPITLADRVNGDLLAFITSIES